MVLKLLILETGTVCKSLINEIAQINEFSICGIVNSTRYVHSKKEIGKHELEKIAAGKKISEFKKNKIISLKDILNATTNYICSCTSEEKIRYETTLKEAQQFGIAERDLSYDVEGIDAAAKLVILSNTIF